MMAEFPDRAGLGTAGPQGQERPRLAVLIPVFNDHGGLAKALASLAQDGTQFDVFVVDDGSDPPIAIPADLPYKVRLVRQEPNQGITAALNAGLARIAEAGYCYVARLDAGDQSLPGRFAAQLAFLDTNPDHAAVGTATRYVDTHGRLLFDYHPPSKHDALVRVYRYRSGIVHPSAMIRMQALLICGYYSDRFPGGEDYDLFMRFTRQYKLANLGSIFVLKEINNKSITSVRSPLVISKLRILVAHFNPWSLHSYLGVLANGMLLLMPRSLMLKLRRLRGNRHTRISC